MKTFRQVFNTTSSLKKSTLEDMSLAPKGKGREAAKKLYKEDDLTEVTPAQRRARKQAYLK